jgi:nitroreductase
MNVQQAIRTKRAVRHFAARPLPAEAVGAILNAGRRAQSSKNTQPWRFIAVRDPTTLEALSHMGSYAGHLAGAALGVAILTPDPAKRWSIMFDAGQAAAYMQLAAWELGIGSCPATIYEPDAARALLRFPADLEVHVALSFGYPADPAVASVSPRPAGRLKLSEVIHYERWQSRAT